MITLRTFAFSLTLGGFALLSPAGALAQEAAFGTSLDALLEYARERNPELATMRHEASAAGERVGAAGALPDPVVRVELQNITNAGSEARPSLLPNRVGATKYTVMQAVPFWGKRDLRTRAAAADAEQAQARTRATWIELATRIKTSFAQYYLAVQAAGITEEQIALIGRIEAVARTRYAAGLGTQQDALRAQVEGVVMKSDLLVQDNERHHAQVRLNALLGRKPGEPLAAPQRLRLLPTAATLDLHALDETRLARNPVLAAEAAREEAARSNRDATYRNRYPDLTIGVSPMQMGGRIGQWELMLEVSIPLQQGTRRAQEREADAMVAAARARREAVTVQALAELGENIASLDVARRQHSYAADQLLPQAEVNLRSALAGYESGRADVATVIEAQRQIRRARFDRLKVAVEAELRRIEIERLLGEDL